MLQGTISSLSGSFGFIAAQPREVFFAASSVEWVNFAELVEGQTVEYELCDGPKPLHIGYRGGPQAALVRPIFTNIQASIGGMLEE
jgi:cold shock CspA family protein